MTAAKTEDREAEFVATHGGVFMTRHGTAGQSAEYSQKKLCFVATDKPFLIALLYELSLREDCYRVKYSAAPREGMYLGRCFLTTDAAAARLCQKYKTHPKLMVTLQDDGFFNAYRDEDAGYFRGAEPLATPALEIVLPNDPADARLDDVRSFLRAHNRLTNQAFMQELETTPAVALLVVGSTQDGAVAGGLIGETRGRWFRVDIMAVREDLRRRGIARRILKAAESEAMSRGCDRAFLETMEYQGPQFYEACGYARRCELSDWDSHGHAKYLYSKELGQSGTRTEEVLDGSAGHQ